MEKDAAVVARVLTMYMLVGVLSHLVHRVSCHSQSGFIV